jgi:hypothetical protein
MTSLTQSMEYGLILEFVGRLPVIATLEDLDEASLKLILTQPKTALMKQYRRLFEMEGVDLTVAAEWSAARVPRSCGRSPSWRWRRPPARPRGRSLSAFYPRAILGRDDLGAEADRARPAARRNDLL